MNRSEIPWNKTIVCDVDDTISSHKDRDYVNAIPIKHIIEKLNVLYDEGWKIIYFTARGQLSCNGDLARIEAERGPILKKWLEQHGVKYDQLLFGKPLAAWYIDDKALTPQEFFAMRFEKLKGGSGASIEVQGDRVIKTAANAKEQAKWYVHAYGSEYDSISNIAYHIPRLHSIIDNTMNMEYVKGVSAAKHLSSHVDLEVIKKILKVVEQIQSARPMQHTSTDVNTYVDRIASHINFAVQSGVFTEEYGFSLLNHIKFSFDRYFECTERSFYHGDFTLENIIIDKMNHSTIKVIDPNNVEGVWGNYFLDVAKLFQSLRFNYEFEFGDNPFEYHPALLDFLTHEVRKQFTSYEYGFINLLELTHWIRMIKYKSPKERLKIKEIIEKLYVVR